MSQTSTTHTQWIRHAVAAAKSGNPSLAKIQLQKAAEESPDDPVVWLWLGWLADSPANAVQCFELAQSSERLQKVVAAGIEFAKGLAEFQLELAPAETFEEAASETTRVAAAEFLPVLDPVEAVEEVAAVVETLQEEESDISETEAVALVQTNASASPDSPDSVDSESPSTEQTTKFETRQDADDDSTDVETNSEPDSVTDVETTVDATDSLLSELESDDVDVSDENVEQLTSDETTGSEDHHPDDGTLEASTIEAELMKAAGEIWQTSAEVTDSAVAAESESVHESASGQQLWKPASNRTSAGTDSTVGSVRISPGATNATELLTDVSEEEFVFANVEDDDGDSIPHDQTAQTENNDTSENAESARDQWWGRPSAETPQAPVWRAAQSDWFSVDAPSGSNDERALKRVDTETTATHVPRSVATAPAEATTENRNEVQDGAVQDGAVQDDAVQDDALSVTLLESEGETVAATDSQATGPVPQSRVTASDVWQRAAIEKSMLSDVSVAQSSTVRPPLRTSLTQASPSAGAAAGELPQALASVSSTSEFGPARFTLRDTANEHFSPRGAAMDPLNRQTVLVVDDSPTVRKLVAITLEKRGYRVVSAFDGVAAIKEIAAHSPALILMDVNMPRLDGYQLCKLVKKHVTTSDIPVLMLTGNDGMFDRLRSRLVGCAGHVTKPFTPEALIEAVERHVNPTKNA
jgi:twitching motility two-component system response regulator PilG